MPGKTHAAKRLYKDLKDAGLTPWLDKESLIAGQNWKIAINKAIKKSRYFIPIATCISRSNSGCYLTLVILFINCLAFSVTFLIEAVLGVIPNFFAPLKTPEINAFHPIPIIAKIIIAITIHVINPIPRLEGSHVFYNF